MNEPIKVQRTSALIVWCVFFSLFFSSTLPWPGCCLASLLWCLLLVGCCCLWSSTHDDGRRGDDRRLGSHSLFRSVWWACCGVRKLVWVPKECGPRKAWRKRKSTAYLQDPPGTAPSPFPTYSSPREMRPARPTTTCRIPHWASVCRPIADSVHRRVRLLSLPSLRGLVH